MDEAGSETSDAEGPHFKAVVGGGASQVASSVGKAPIVEEEEEENPDVCFKRKLKDFLPPKPHKKHGKEGSSTCSKGFYCWG